MSNQLNQSAIKEHALACSKAHRGGKFSRVGADFLIEVESEVEAFVREIRNRYPVQIHEPLATDERFVTGALMEKIQAELNAAVARIIQQRVQRQPTLGKTLGRTQ